MIGKAVGTISTRWQAYVVPKEKWLLVNSILGADVYET